MGEVGTDACNYYRSHRAVQPMTQTPKLLPIAPERDGADAASESVVTEALRMLRLTGAVYLRGEFSGPWGFESLSRDDMIATLCPRAEQLVILHAIIEGSCEVVLETGESVAAEEGDFVVLPYGHQHSMRS